MPGDSSTPNDRGESKDGPTAGAPVVNTHWAKYNSKVDTPSYSDEEYVQHLTSAEWTKDETDYLMRLAQACDLRWIIIADRYDYRPPDLPAAATATDGTGAAAAAPAPPARAKEDLKARFYEVAAKTMALRQPLDRMTPAEFARHETMTQFDAARERTRTRLVEALLTRAPEEAKEEEILLSELKRIVVGEDAFLQERRELYDSLDYPVAQGSIAMYESSQGLVQLMQTLHAADREKKKKGGAGSAALRTSGVGADNAASPAQATPTTTGGPRDHRGSTSGPHGHKRTSTGGGGAAGPPGSHVRALTPREEAKYGVARPERAGSGVTFRHARLEKLLLAKSAAQAAKLQDALAELGVPVRAVMPTARVCAAYERLVGKVHGLLDARKLGEKVAGEIRVLRAQREAREKRERGEADDEGEAAVAGDGAGRPDAAADKEGSPTGAADGTTEEPDAADEAPADDGDEDEVIGVPEGDDPGDDDDDDDDAEGASAKPSPAADADTEMRDADDGAEPDADDDDDADGDAHASIAGSTRSAAASRKRSVSVLSGASEKSAKRLRK